MADFRPFSAWRPHPENAAAVACVPYDVVDTAEARALAAGNALSLLHATRPDIDLPDDADTHGPAAYAAARSAWTALCEQGALQLDPFPGYFVYAQTMDGRRQVGIAGLASAADYAAGRIKKHEHTRPDKEDDRKHHIEAVGAQLEPVFLAFRATPGLQGWLDSTVKGKPEVDFVAEDGIRHQVWPVFNPMAIINIVGEFHDIEALYIADGHHRTAAAARVGEGKPADDASNHFLAVAFPHSELRILPYNRVVEDLNGRTPAGFLAALAPRWTVEPAPAAVTPGERHQVGMCLAGQWYRMTLRPECHPDPHDPVARLDVSVLQEAVLAPLLGIADPRTSTRIRFIGGIRGTEALTLAVGTEARVAFSMYPTSLEDLMAIADAGQVMPPKSTWFEPKLRSGLFVNVFEE